MPRAHIGDVPRWLQDHDTDRVDEDPPVQNTWYEAFHAQDVRLIWCVIRQDNDETVAKVVEVLWTIDGNEYLESIALDNASLYYVYRDFYPSSGGTAGLFVGVAKVLAAQTTDKRGLDFQVEVRLTGVPGTNQRLRCWCVRETQEIT